MNSKTGCNAISSLLEPTTETESTNEVIIEPEVNEFGCSPTMLPDLSVMVSHIDKTEITNESYEGLAPIIFTVTLRATPAQATTKGKH
jgi:hypothetical protein